MLAQASVNPYLPALVMGGTAIVAGLSGFLLPETRGTKLPEGFENGDKTHDFIVERNKHEDRWVASVNLQ